MPQARPCLLLVPAGLVLKRVEPVPGEVAVIARSPSRTSNCPSCGTASRAAHSRYQQAPSDLPSHGHAVRIRLQVRRFRCGRHGCRQRIFAERLDDSIARPFARRTTRLERIVHHVGLALGGRPGQSLARRLLLPVSRDTLLHVVRHHAELWKAPPRIVGIDDWGWKRGHRYGTIVRDLERRRIIDLLPDRATAPVQSWPAARPSVAVIARDRGGGYGQAASRGVSDPRKA